MGFRISHDVEGYAVEPESSGGRDGALPADMAVPMPAPAPVPQVVVAAALVDRAASRLYIRRADVQKYGYCLGCRSVMTNTTARAHTEECPCCVVLFVTNPNVMLLSPLRNGECCDACVLTGEQFSIRMALVGATHHSHMRVANMAAQTDFVPAATYAATASSLAPATPVPPDAPAPAVKYVAPTRYHCD